MLENSRVKEVRKAKNLTLESFGKMLGVQKSAISKIERGENAVSDQIRLAICREFNVSETWLRTGEGEMFRELSRDEELAKFFGEVSFGESDFKRRFLTVLSQLDESGWQLLEDMALKLAEEAKKDKEKAGP